MAAFTEAQSFTRNGNKVDGPAALAMGLVLLCREADKGGIKTTVCTGKRDDTQASLFSAVEKALGDRRRQRLTTSHGRHASRRAAHVVREASAA